jgi:hypothetical protein
MGIVRYYIASSPNEDTIASDAGAAYIYIPNKSRTTT